MKFRKLLISGIAGAAILAGVGAATLPATAGTSPPPSPTAFKGYEGAQVSADHSNTIAAKGAYAGAVVYATPYSASNPAVRFLWVRPFPMAYGDPQAKIAIYAPNGVPTNLVLTQSGSQILLAAYVGCQNQIWTSSTYANPYGTSWMNEHSGGYIREIGAGKPLTTIGAVPWKQTAFSFAGIGG